MDEAKTVYLDSNDFSDLSKPNDQLTDSDKEILQCLREAKRDGRAKFYISPIHLSEAVHASDAHKTSAVNRARLMQEFGAGNILQFPHKICEIELRRAFEGASNTECSFFEILSKEDEWFGIKSPKDHLNDQRVEINNALDNALQSLSRKERRRRKSELNTQKKSGRDAIRALIKEGQRKTASPIPTSLMNPDLVVDWYLREKTDEDLRANSLRIMSDPYLLFNFFIDEIGHREKLYNIVRDQGLKWAKFIEEGMSQLAPLMGQARELDIPVDLKIIQSQITSELFWQKVIGSLSEIDLSDRPQAEIRAAMQKSPSTSVYIHAILETLMIRMQSTRARVAEGNQTPAKAKASDYADFMHAIYAPYFDIFRCDTRFGSALRTFDGVKGKVASKRSELIKMLQQA